MGNQFIPDTWTYDITLDLNTTEVEWVNSLLNISYTATNISENTQYFSSVLENAANNMSNFTSNISAHSSIIFSTTNTVKLYECYERYKMP